MFGERGRCDLSPLLSLLLSFLGVQLAPLISPLLGDCPEPQEVLVSKEACLQFGSNVSLGLRLPPLALLALAACHQRGWSAAGYFCSVLCSVCGPGGVLC